MWIVAFAIAGELTSEDGIGQMFGFVIGLFFLGFWFTYLNGYIKNGKILQEKGIIKKYQPPVIIIVH